MLLPEPIFLKDANIFIAEHHRHHKPMKFHLFSIAATDEEFKRVGVAMVMRPVNTYWSKRSVAEVSRLCTDGTKNACSFLLSRCARITFEMGYLAIQTYTLPEEGGASLKAAGWEWTHETKVAPWTSATRKRNDNHPIEPKWRWIKYSPRLEKLMAETSLNSDQEKSDG